MTEEEFRALLAIDGFTLKVNTNDMVGSFAVIRKEDSKELDYTRADTEDEALQKIMELRYGNN